MDNTTTSNYGTQEKEGSLTQNLGIQGRIRSKTLRNATKIKPWSGPLPRREHPRKCSLGDIWVKDIRATAIPMECKRLNKFLADEGSVSIEVESSVGKCSKNMLVSNCESKKEQEIQIQNPITWVGETGFIKVGAHAVFQCINGLGRLFKQRGKPKDLIRHNHSSIRRGI